MNKGVSYINLIVYVTIFLSIFAIIGGSFFYFENKTAQLRIHYQLIGDINLVLNKIAFEVKSSRLVDNYSFPTDSKQLSFINARNKSYTLQEKNSRLAKRSISTSYLTEKETQIKDFKITKQDPNCYTISFKASKNNHTVSFRRSLRFINV